MPTPATKTEVLTVTSFASDALDLVREVTLLCE
jgi:hypothetical protein